MYGSWNWFMWIEAEPISIAFISLVTSGLDYGDPIKMHLIASAPHMRLFIMGAILLITAELTFDITMGDIAFALAFGTAKFITSIPMRLSRPYLTIVAPIAKDPAINQTASWAYVATTFFGSVIPKNN